ncbi:MULTISPECIES: ComEA family DNA-binding protein [unclassified Mycobacterium]|uniref:ComEA family DNA-binding protein n=1 Tax=unclassified Mycobacterium TaxID=2642494 RepID=UPI0029C941CB|nr:MULTISPECIES: ComEA family DNA-binding protein [unclassified Mycobacterium]
MRSELPADRVRRRLAGEATAEAEVDPVAEDDDPTDTSLSRWLPDTGGARPNWMDAIRADPGRSGVIALGALGLVAVLVTIFTLAHDDGPRVVSANLPPVQPVSSTGATAAGQAPAAQTQVVVSVVGLVREPGLVTLGPEARIADALDAAGGALDGADLTGLNMARRVADGEQLVVGLAAAPGAPPAMGSSVSTPPGGAPATPGVGQPSSAPDAPIDLNAATVEQLDALPGVGPVTASAIVAWRTTNGRFANVDQLGEVDGIGPARLEKLRELVHV